MVVKYEAAERELVEATHANTEYMRDTLYAIEENVKRLCKAWDVKPVRSGYDEAHSEE